jgi:hypothetical protein
VELMVEVEAFCRVEAIQSHHISCDLPHIGPRDRIFGIERVDELIEKRNELLLIFAMKKLRPSKETVLERISSCVRLSPLRPRARALLRVTAIGLYPFV